MFVVTVLRKSNALFLNSDPTLTDSLFRFLSLVTLEIRRLRPDRVSYFNRFNH